MKLLLTHSIERERVQQIEHSSEFILNLIFFQPRSTRKKKQLTNVKTSTNLLNVKQMIDILKNGCVWLKNLALKLFSNQNELVIYDLFNQISWRAATRLQTIRIIYFFWKKIYFQVLLFCLTS